MQNVTAEFAAHCARLSAAHAMERLTRATMSGAPSARLAELRRAYAQALANAIAAEQRQ